MLQHFREELIDNALSKACCENRQHVFVHTDQSSDTFSLCGFQMPASASVKAFENWSSLQTHIFDAITEALIVATKTRKFKWAKFIRTNHSTVFTQLCLLTNQKKVQNLDFSHATRQLDLYQDLLSLRFFNIFCWGGGGGGLIVG